jgi:hypothetical protein
VGAEAATMAVASAAQGAISAAAAEEAAARAASVPAGVGTGTKQTVPSAELPILRLNFILSLLETVFFSLQYRNLYIKKTIKM